MERFGGHGQKADAVSERPTANLIYISYVCIICNMHAHPV
jgi:hypothetical protein